MRPRRASIAAGPGCRTRSAPATILEMDRLRRRFLIGFGSLAFSATAALAQQPASTPNTPDGLRQVMADIYAAIRDGDSGKSRALVRSLRLGAHDAWFNRVFGTAIGPKLGAEYAEWLPRFETDAAFVAVVQKGQSDIRVLRFDRADDPAAVGNQKDAMVAMKIFQPLYSVRFVRPGEQLGMHIYSFVHVDNGFRFVGRMAAAKP